MVAEKIFQCVSTEGRMSIAFLPAGHASLDIDLSDVILKGDHPRTIVTKFGSS